MAIVQVEGMEEDPSLVVGLANLSLVGAEQPEPPCTEAASGPREGFAMESLVIW